MRLFYYAHTGHRIGLDRFRRAVGIIKALQNEGVDVTLLTSDYRIAGEARAFGVQKSVGIDVVRNIANIAEKGDALIFDSKEANALMLEDMREYFSAFIRLSDEADDTKANNEYVISPYLEGEGICNAIAVDDDYFGEFTKSVKLSFFFGDDDYEKDLEKHLDFVKGLDAALQLGFYYFLDYEAMLRKHFSKVFEFEEYEEMIKESEIVLTASPQAVLEALSAGSKPIYFQREDYESDFLPLFTQLNIPTIRNYDRAKLDAILETISYNDYKKIEKNCYKIAKFIKNCLNL